MIQIILDILPLMVAINNIDNHKIYELLKFNPDLNIKANDGCTALEIATDKQIKKIID